MAGGAPLLRALLRLLQPALPLLRLLRLARLQPHRRALGRAESPRGRFETYNRAGSAVDTHSAVRRPSAGCVSFAETARL